MKLHTEYLRLRIVNRKPKCKLLSCSYEGCQSYLEMLNISFSQGCEVKANKMHKAIFSDDRDMRKRSSFAGQVLAENFLINESVALMEINVSRPSLDRYKENYNHVLRGWILTRKKMISKRLLLISFWMVSTVYASSNPVFLECKLRLERYIRSNHGEESEIEGRIPSGTVELMIDANKMVSEKLASDDFLIFSYGLSWG